MRHFLAVPIYLIVSAVFAATNDQVREDDGSHVTIDNAATGLAADGFRLYQENCSVCHGDNGRGALWGQQTLASAPRDFGSEASRTELTRDRMIASVSYGRPGTPMPGFASQLAPEQVAAIVDYVRTAFMHGGIQAPAESSVHSHDTDNAVTQDYRRRAMPLGLSGNADRGYAFYTANCVECHGDTGNGDGPRAYFIYPRPRNFLDPATQQIFNRPRLFDGIKQGVIGKEMPAWGKVLTDQQIADVAEYVYRAFISGDDTVPGPDIN